uniref:Ovule protein n=1 Tax=Brugia timori TaxID=42155 RepID=A0A0R3QMQ8_9BILA
LERNRNASYFKKFTCKVSNGLKASKSGHPNGTGSNIHLYLALLHTQNFKN